MGKLVIRFGSVLALFVLTALSLLPGPVDENRAMAATPVIPAMLLQAIGESENQCRIARESCMINSNRCKANDDFEAQLTKQCRDNIQRRYDRCESRRLSTLRPLGSNLNNGQRPSAIDQQNYQQEAVLRACGRKPHPVEMQKSCPARKGGCYSSGYCTQQYQRCSSSAALADQADQQRIEPPAGIVPPPPVRRTKPPVGVTRPHNEGEAAIKMRPRPDFFQVRITNTCSHPVRAAYAYNWGPKNRDYDVWGWETIPARGDAIVKLPSKMHNFYVHFDKGKLDRKYQTRQSLFINHDSDFRVGLNLENRPENPDVPEAEYAYVTGSGWLMRQDYRKYDYASVTGCTR